MWLFLDLLIQLTGFPYFLPTCTLVFTWKARSSLKSLNCKYWQRWSHCTRRGATFNRVLCKLFGAMSDDSFNKCAIWFKNLQKRSSVRARIALPSEIWRQSDSDAHGWSHLWILSQANCKHQRTVYAVWQRANIADRVFTVWYCVSIWLLVTDSHSNQTDWSCWRLLKTWNHFSLWARVCVCVCVHMFFSTCSVTHICIYWRCLLSFYRFFVTTL